MLRIFLVVALVLALSGCAATKKDVSTAQSGQELQARVADLEAQLKDKDSQIQDLQSKLARTQKGVVVTPAVDFSKATPKQIQAALKNAGFYNGTIDGKVGKVTKDAIKEFQKANGLNPDGVIGKQTWAKLSQFLN